MSARRLAKPSTVFPYELNQVFHASTYGSEHACAVRAEHDRHPPARRWQQDRVVDGMKLALERHVLAGEEAPHDIERLRET